MGVRRGVVPGPPIGGTGRPRVRHDDTRPAPEKATSRSDGGSFLGAENPDVYIPLLAIEKIDNATRATLRWSAEVYEISTAMTPMPRRAVP